jgi:hypothetical protein
MSDRDGRWEPDLYVAATGYSADEWAPDEPEEAEFEGLDPESELDLEEDRATDDWS